MTDPATHSIKDDQQAIEDAIYSLTLACELLARHNGTQDEPAQGFRPDDDALAALIRDPVNKVCLAAVDVLAKRLGEIVSDQAQIADVFGRIHSRVMFAVNASTIPSRLQ